MKKKKALRIVALTLFLGGLGVFLFPYAAQFVYQKQADRVIWDYGQRIETLREQDKQAGENSLEKLYNDIKQYNEALFRSMQLRLNDPFFFEQPSFSLKDYGLEEELIGHLILPQLGENLPVYLGASNSNMRKGAALLSETSIPVGGENTNAVIAAHRGMSTAAMFRHIEKLVVGDEITLVNFRESLTYRVAEIRIIRPDDVASIAIQPGRDLLTLLTCHPYGSNSQRYVVYCERKA